MKSINIDILGNALFYETAKPFLLDSSAASIVQIATITAIEHHDVRSPLVTERRRLLRFV